MSINSMSLTDLISRRRTLKNTCETNIKRQVILNTNSFVNKPITKINLCQGKLK